MSANESFLDADEIEANVILDDLSAGKELWAILSKGIQGEMTCQELGYEVKSLMDRKLESYREEHERHCREAKRGDFDQPDEHEVGIPA